MIPQIGLKAALLAFVLVGGGATALASSPSVPTTDATGRLSVVPTALRPVLYLALAKDAGRAYVLDDMGCASLPQQRLKVCFDSHGAHFTGANSPLSLHLEGWGRAGDFIHVSMAKPAIAGNCASYVHGNLAEWWRVLPVGIEQGFAIARRPSGKGELELTLSANDHANRHGDAFGWGDLRYGKLVVTDAKGKVIPSKLESEGDDILISVNDAQAVYPLTVDPLVWIEQRVSATDGVSGDEFGYSVAVSGNTAVVGAVYAATSGNALGAAYIFTNSGNGWGLAQKLVPSDGTAYDYFGWSTAVSGTTIFVGAPNITINGNSSQGAVYVFNKSGNTWSQSQKLTAKDGASGDSFGTSIALSGTTALIGADGATVGGNSGQGAAYVFSYVDGTWTQAQKLTADDGATYSYFGWSSALSGTTALVGADGATVSGNSGQGAAYVFSYSNGIWTQDQKLTANDGATYNFFGRSVSIVGSNALIGASYATVNGNAAQGAVYVFDDSGGTWNQTQKLVASDGTANSFFGSSIASQDQTVVIGAPTAMGPDGNQHGAAYLFTDAGGTWSQGQKLTASDFATGSSELGVSVALFGNTVLTGATGSNSYQGAAYFYGRSNLGLVLSAPGTVGRGWDYVSKAIATNNATAASPAVALTVAVPVAASFVSAMANQGGCSEALGMVTCQVGQIAGNGGTATASVMLKATGDAGGVIEDTGSVANTAPSLRANAVTRINNPPLASDGSLQTHPNQAANGVLKASDSDGDPLIFSIVTPPAHGRVAINDAHKGLYTYTPAAGYAAGDSFTFKASDGYEDSNVATVVINIINRPPVASDGTLTTDKNTAAKGTLEASDPDGDALSFTIVSPPGNGRLKLDSATGAYTYTPATDYFGPDSFTFKASDGQSDSNVATVSVTVQGSAPPPPTPPSNNGGGGGFGGLLLMLLAALTAATAWLRKPIAFFRRAAKAHVGRHKEQSDVAGVRHRIAGNALRAYPGLQSLVWHRTVGAASAAIKKARIATEVAPTPDSSMEADLAYSPLEEEREKAHSLVGWHKEQSDIAGVRRRLAGNALRAYPDLRRLPHAPVQKSRASALLHRLGSICRSVPCRRAGVKARASGRQNQLGTKQKETNMRIHGKWATVAVSLLALTVIVGAAFAPISSAAPNHSAMAVHHKPSGLTNWGIEAARKSGLPSHLMAMAPQSSLTLLARATKLGLHAPDSTIELTVALKLRNVAKLKSFLEQVQDPHSAVYHQWLTPAEFTRLYGPTKADIAEVTAFLKTHGIKVKNVSSNRMLIHTEASTGVYEHALGIRINDYKLDGRRFYSTGDTPRLPRAIAPLVVNILGLNHGVQMRSHLFQRPLMSAHGLSPREAPPVSLTNLNPLQIAHAYNYPDITDATNGAGVDVAILTAESSGLAGLSDPHDFWTAFGLPDHTINVIPVDGDNGSTGGMGETLLDVEYSGAMGPGITQNVYVAANTQLATFTDMYNQFANDTNPDGSVKDLVMTTSWGSPETNGGSIFVADDQIFMQAAAEGISMFAAAGDHGSGDNTGQDNVADYPSSSLYITAANGTQLTISDLAGDYGSEVVWNDADCFGNGPAATGGAVSQLFDKPDWQTGPGVPTDIDMRMNSDMAATASCTKPMLVLQGGQWYLTSGTSAVAPQFAGLFAIAVAENGDSLGQSNKLIYNDANSHYASDFHDVTEGNNGAFEAGPNWDHPTGWGTPNVQNLLSHIGIQGPKGTFTGSVTDAASGASIVGAHVAAVASDGTEYDATTGGDGTYSRVLPVGHFTVTTSDYGYTNGTASVSINNDSTTKQDFALQVAPLVTLSGKVTDGSGHDYGLYADIKVSAKDFGQVTDVWTNPETGKYSVKLPKGVTYTLNVVAAFDGYNTASKTLILSSNKSENFALTVTDACTAPGYSSDGDSNGFNQDFNGTWPPVGWKVTNGISDSPITWNNGNTAMSDAGSAAMVDSGSAYPYKGNYDTSLVTPPINVAALDGTILKYKASFQNYGGNGTLDLDITTDAGTSWRNILHWVTNHGSFESPPDYKAQVNIQPYLPTSGNFQLRWRYYDLAGGWDWYARIDDVAIGGACQPLPGALVFGQVSTYDTGDGIVGATVTDEAGNTTTTIRNPADPNFPVGTYGFFESAGNHTLTASYPNYDSDSASLNVVNNKIATQNFSLKAGQLSTTPNAFTLHVMVNNLATATLALKNTGSGDASFEALPINAPPPGSTRAVGPFAAAPHYAAKKDLATLVAAGVIVRRSQSVPSIRHSGTHVGGTPISDFPAGISIYGLGADHNTSSLWLGSPSYSGLGGDDKDHRFLFDGTNTGDVIDVSNPNILYMADMAFDDTTGTIWQLSIDGSNGSTSHIIELDPTTMMPTGNSILVPSPQSERGLAYDPLSNTWYAGDFNSETVYHFNASGTLLDSMDVGLPIVGLAYNPATGHLFVLTSGGDSAVYVLDVKNEYALVGSFDIDGFDSANAGAGLGYDCDGNLWISDYVNKVVWQVNSGEFGWCAEKSIPWLNLAPEEGTVAAGTSTDVKLTFDGTGQKEFTTSNVYLNLVSNTPYPDLIVPLTVTWEPQPVNLSLTGEASPLSARKGDTQLYTLTVYNRHASNHGAATLVKLSYPLPQGVSYQAASGDAACTAPAAGSTPAPAAGTVICDFGTIALGASKTETLVVKANTAGKLSSTFEVGAREPDSNSDDNQLTLTSEVIGSADLSLDADSASIPAGGTGSLTLTLKNAGPDPAAEVQLHAKAGSGVATLRSATASQGHCTLSGGVTCALGQVDAGATVTVTMQLFGAYAGNATVNAQASTASNEADTSNNGVAAKVTVKAASSPNNGGGSGGGALGWLALVALLGLAVPALARRWRA